MATISERKNRQGQLIGWQVKIRRKGVPQESKTFDSYEAAKRYARKIDSAIDERRHRSPKAAEDRTLRDLIERYIQEITPHHKGAVQEKSRLDQLADHRVTEHSVALLTSVDFASWRDERLKYVSAGTVIRELNLFHAVIETARREWGVYLHENPVHLVRRPPASKARDRRLVGDEEERLLAACDEDPDPFLRSVVEVAIETGMRQGELCGLPWNDVRFDLRYAVVRDTKNGDTRGVPLSTKAVAVLEDLALPSQLAIQLAKVLSIPKEAGSPRWSQIDLGKSTVTMIAGEDEKPKVYIIPQVWKAKLSSLPAAGKGLVFGSDNTNALKMRFRRACARAGISGLTFHDLRHEATSRLFELGLGMMEVAAIVGHRTLQMLKRYTHLQAADLAKKLG